MMVLQESFAGDSLDLEKARPCFDTASVSLYFASQNNPDVSGVLVTYIEVPGDCRDIFEAIGREILKQPFDNFDCDQDVSCRFAYYKLCAMRHFVEEGGDSVCLLLDTDTWINMALNDFEFEIVRGSCYMPCVHRYWWIIVCSYARSTYDFFGGDSVPYGGELVLCGIEGINSLLGGTSVVMEKMENTGVLSKRGDESLSFAAGAL